MTATADSDSRETLVAGAAVRLHGHHVSLRPVRPQDYDSLRALEFSEDLVPLWRHQGTTPSPERWNESLWNGVLAQFLVVDSQRNEPLGLVSVYNYDFRHGYAYFAAVKFDLHDRSPLFLEGVALFVDYVFTAWDFRKLYAETTDLSIGRFGSALGWLLIEEGCLRNHRYFSGRYWDLRLLALYRDTWVEIASPLRRLL